MEKGDVDPDSAAGNFDPRPNQNGVNAEGPCVCSNPSLYETSGNS